MQIADRIPVFLRAFFRGPVRPGPPLTSRFLRCYERRLQRRHLRELDDHLLRDIGVTRERVAAECRKPFWR